MLGLLLLLLAATGMNSLKSRFGKWVARSVAALFPQRFTSKLQSLAKFVSWSISRTTYRSAVYPLALWSFNQTNCDGDHFVWVNYLKMGHLYHSTLFIASAWTQRWPSPLCLNFPFLLLRCVVPYVAIWGILGVTLSAKRSRWLSPGILDTHMAGAFFCQGPWQPWRFGRFGSNLTCEDADIWTRGWFSQRKESSREFCGHRQWQEAEAWFGDLCHAPSLQCDVLLAGHWPPCSNSWIRRAGCVPKKGSQQLYAATVDPGSAPPEKTCEKAKLLTHTNCWQPILHAIRRRIAFTSLGPSGANLIPWVYRKSMKTCIYPHVKKPSYMFGLICLHPNLWDGRLNKPIPTFICNASKKRAWSRGSQKW